MREGPGRRKRGLFGCVPVDVTAHSQRRAMFRSSGTWFFFLTWVVSLIRWYGLGVQRSVSICCQLSPLATAKTRPCDDRGTREPHEFVSEGKRERGETEVAGWMGSGQERRCRC